MCIFIAINYQQEVKHIKYHAVNYECTSECSAMIYLSLCLYYSFAVLSPLELLKLNILHDGFLGNLLVLCHSRQNMDIIVLLY